VDKATIQKTWDRWGLKGEANFENLSLSKIGEVKTKKGRGREGNFKGWVVGAKPSWPYT